MTPDEEQEALRRMAHNIDSLAKAMALNARAIGVEWTKSDAEEVIRDGFKNAQRDIMRKLFLDLLGASDIK